jgi:hypothetical protein
VCFVACHTGRIWPRRYEAPLKIELKFCPNAIFNDVGII